MSNISSNAWDETCAQMLALESPELLAQHFMQHGVIYALNFVLEHDADRSLITKMLVDARAMQDLISATAATRGLRIPSGG